jgi:cytochrome P450
MTATNTPQIYDLYSQNFKANAYTVYAKMRREDPVSCQLDPNGETIYYITRYAEAEAVLLDHQRFVKDRCNALTPEELEARPPFITTELDQLLTCHMLNRDADDHRRMRGLVTRAFTPRMVATFEPRIQQIADNLIDKMQEHGTDDLISAFAFPLPITVIAELLGVPTADRDRFRIWSDAIVTPVEDRDAFVALMHQFVDFLRKMVENKRAHPTDDLVSGLVQAEEDGDKLSGGELFSMVMLLIVAGHETTVNLIGNGILALLQHPRQLAALRRNPTLIKSAIEEILRYDSPVERTTWRWAAQDVLLCGQLIPRGSIVQAVLGSANRDPKRFEDADTFDINRSENRHLSMGLGPHFCLGAALARLEGRVAISTLLKRLPLLRLAMPAKQLRWRETPVIRGLERLPVAW